MVENTIIIGDNEYTFTGADILQLTTSRSTSILLDEMVSDVCEAVVVSNSDYIDSLGYGTRVGILRDAAVQDVFYLTKVTRIKKNQYKLDMTSFLGILESEMFYGGYYTGESFQNVIESIIQTNGLNPNTTDHADMLGLIEYDTGVASLPVYGWLKVGTKKESIHQVLFSQGIAMKRSTGGVIMFSTMYDTDPVVIPDSETYDDNDVAFLPNVSEIEVEEHAFTDDQSVEQTVLYENREATSVGRVYVAVFNCDAPVLRPISTSGLLVLYQNCNAAIVTGMGTIRGYPAVHSTTMIRETISLVKGETKSVTGCTLVTLANSAFIFDRFKNFYSTAETEISTGIVRENEKTGSHVSVVNSFGERVTGFITEMNETYSGIVRADSKIVTGYTPQERPDGFNRSVLLHGSGAWIVPDSVYEKSNPAIKIVLIGGGTGGYSGKAGANGVKVNWGDTSTTGAQGGEGGYGGTGGKIYEIEVVNPERTLYFNCGQGGAGGSQSSSHSVSNAGSDGGDTTLTNGGATYSSGSGSRNDYGVVNFLTGIRYAANNYYSLLMQFIKLFSNGAPGGKGFHIPALGQWTSAPGGSCYGIVFDLNSSSPKYDFTQYDGGEYGTKAEGRYYNGYETIRANSNGGSGGGAAAGSNGGRGGDAWGGYADYGGIAGGGGTGGKGADATLVFPKPNDVKATSFLPWDDGGYGDGGFGGFGGGGGGSGGPTYREGFTPGNGGTGGKGGQGGSGGDGCILIYY